MLDTFIERHEPQAGSCLSCQSLGSTIHRSPVERACGDIQCTKALATAAPFA